MKRHKSQHRWQFKQLTEDWYVGLCSRCPASRTTARHGPLGRFTTTYQIGNRTFGSGECPPCAPRSEVKP